MTPQEYTAWFTTYPEGHAHAGETVEVVPRRLLAEMVERIAATEPDPKLVEVRERAACVVERACEQLESASLVGETIATDLRATMLQLIEMATR